MHSRQDRILEHRIRRLLRRNVSLVLTNRIRESTRMELPPWTAHGWDVALWDHLAMLFEVVARLRTGTCSEK